jgi:hypothetical protein
MSVGCMAPAAERPGDARTDDIDMANSHARRSSIGVQLRRCFGSPKSLRPNYELCWQDVTSKAMRAKRAAWGIFSTSFKNCGR